MLEFDDDLAYEHGTLNMSDLGHRYLWGPAVDELLADENASSNVITWPLPDHLGTIRDWVNNSGTNLDHVEYDTAGRRNWIRRRLMRCLAERAYSTTSTLEMTTPAIGGPTRRQAAG